MKFSDEFGGKYWKAADLVKPRLLTISKFEYEPMMGNLSDMKWVAYFAEDKRGLVLNQTNGNMIKSLFGDDSERCTGKKIVLFQSNTEMQGRTVPCIRVRAPKEQAPPAAQKEVNSDPPDDEIPF